MYKNYELDEQAISNIIHRPIKTHWTPETN